MTSSCREWSITGKEQPCRTERHSFCSNILALTLVWLNNSVTVQLACNGGDSTACEASAASWVRASPTAVRRLGEGSITRMAAHIAPGVPVTIV